MFNAFKPLTTCVNCERKCFDYLCEGQSENKKKGNKRIPEEKEECNGKGENKKVYKRCSGCKFMIYCDVTCQREHWNIVHKYHCKYLSGKKVGDEHKEDFCAICIEQKKSDKEEIGDLNSPKIGCRLEEENKRMIKELRHLSGFHDNCSQEYSCKRLFPLGDIFDKHVCTGLDQMMVQTAELSKAILNKTMNALDIDKKSIDHLSDLHKIILDLRLDLWYAILIHGNSARVAVPIFFKLLRPLNALNDKLGLNVLNNKLDQFNAWWKALKFSLGIILSVCLSKSWNWKIEYNDPSLVEARKHHESHLQNVLFVFENGLWPRFKLWPTIVNQSLVLCLPEEIHCVSCNANLAGEEVDVKLVGILSSDALLSVKMGPHDRSYIFTLSRDDLSLNQCAMLFPGVSKDGGFTVCCSSAKNPSCITNSLDKIAKLDLSEEAVKEKQAMGETARVCQLCLRKSSSSHRCADCRAVQYCSIDCANYDFAFHKTVCSTWAKDSTRKLMSPKKQKEVIIAKCKESEEKAKKNVSPNK